MCFWVLDFACRFKFLSAKNFSKYFLLLCSSAGYSFSPPFVLSEMSAFWPHFLKAAFPLVIDLGVDKPIPRLAPSRCRSSFLRLALAAMQSHLSFLLFSTRESSSFSWMSFSSWFSYLLSSSVWLPRVKVQFSAWLLSCLWPVVVLLRSVGWYFIFWSVCLHINFSPNLPFPFSLRIQVHISFVKFIMSLFPHPMCVLACVWMPQRPEGDVAPCELQAPISAI